MITRGREVGEMEFLVKEYELTQLCRVNNSRELMCKHDDYSRYCCIKSWKCAERRNSGALIAHKTGNCEEVMCLTVVIISLCICIPTHVVVQFIHTHTL